MSYLVIVALLLVIYLLVRFIKNCPSPDEYNELLEHNKKLRHHVSSLDDLETIKKNLALFEPPHEVLASGLYKLSLPVETPDELKRQLEEKRQALSKLIKEGKAAICATEWSINGDEKEGKKAIKNCIRIMLRTFNADADACLESVRWDNFTKCKERIKASYEYVNKMGESYDTKIQPKYLKLRVEQLEIMFKYKEAQHHHKEEMRKVREALAEEAKVKRDLERAKKDAEKQEALASEALKIAQEKLVALAGQEKEEMLSKIAKLQEELKAAHELNKRALSLAQQTKAGFVYIISNIGSFGEDVFKIGMTRRIEPLDRVKELGDASVPFGFDVHALIYSEDAPALENAFHKQFTKHRVNLANGRKEFFKIPLTEIMNFAKTLSLDAEFISEIEAKDFRISEDIRKNLLSDLTAEELEIKLSSSLAEASDEELSEEV